MLCDIAQHGAPLLIEEGLRGFGCVWSGHCIGPGGSRWHLGLVGAQVTGGRGPPLLLLRGFLRWRLLGHSSGHRKGDVGSDPGACRGWGGALAVGSLGEQKRVPQVVRGT